MEIRLLDTAKDDLREGWKFYEKNAAGLGDYFLDCIQADVRSLKVFAGIHEMSVVSIGCSMTLDYRGC